MRAGELDKRVELQAKTITRNAFKEEIVTYTTLATVWAAFLNKRGREFYSGDMAYTDKFTMIKIRYRRDITNIRRIKYGNDNYDIEYIDNVKEENKEIVLTCRLSK